MKKKITLTLIGLVCALCCAFGFTACGGGKDDANTKVKDEAQWKQAIADARKCDKVLFSAELENDEYKFELTVEAAGKTQYVKLWNENKKSLQTGSLEYYHDGDYVYNNVANQGLGYTWQKIDAKTVTDDFAEPIGYIDMVYSGEFASGAGFDLKFDGLDELSNRYADAQYGFNSEKYGADTYVIVDGDASANGIVYTLKFSLDINYLRFGIDSSDYKLHHRIGDDYNSPVVVNIPTESVQMADDTNS